MEFSLLFSSYRRATTKMWVKVFELWEPLAHKATSSLDSHLLQRSVAIEFFEAQRRVKSVRERRKNSSVNLIKQFLTSQYHHARNCPPSSRSMRKSNWIQSMTHKIFLHDKTYINVNGDLFRKWKKKFHIKVLSRQKVVKERWGKMFN